MKHFSILSLLAILFLVSACGGDDDSTDPTPTCDTTDITYNNFVGDVLSESCAFSGCHASGLTGFGLTTYDEVTNYANLDKMVDALRREAGVLPMPRDTSTQMATDTPLDDCTIDKIEAWIADGTPE